MSKATITSTKVKAINPIVLSQKGKEIRFTFNKELNSDYMKKMSQSDFTNMYHMWEDKIARVSNDIIFFLVTKAALILHLKKSNGLLDKEKIQAFYKKYPALALRKRMISNYIRIFELASVPYSFSGFNAYPISRTERLMGMTCRYMKKDSTDINNLILKDLQSLINNRSVDDGRNFEVIDKKMDVDADYIKKLDISIKAVKKEIDKLAEKEDKIEANSDLDEMMQNTSLAQIFEKQAEYESQLQKFERKKTIAALNGKLAHLSIQFLEDRDEEISLANALKKIGKKRLESLASLAKKYPDYKRIANTLDKEVKDYNAANNIDDQKKEVFRVNFDQLKKEKEVIEAVEEGFENILDGVRNYSGEIIDFLHDNRVMGEKLVKNLDGFSETFNSYVMEEMKAIGKEFKSSLDELKIQIAKAKK